MPNIRRKFCQARPKQRLISFLQTKCFICLDSPNHRPSKPLPCCNKYIHEDCLLGCLRFAGEDVRDRCPHCQTRLTTYHVSRPVSGPNQFCFKWTEYPPPPPPPPDPNWWLEYYRVPDDHPDPFPNYVLPPAPPTWHTFRHYYSEY